MVKTTASPLMMPRLPPSGAHSARRLNKPNCAHESTTSSKPPPCSVALCKTETVLLSATGDILVCRCRESSKAYQPRSLTRAQNVWMDKAQAHGQNGNEESGWDALSATCSEIADHYSENLCPCNVDDSKQLEMEIPQYVESSRRGGLLGGAAPLADQIDQTESTKPMYAQQHPMNSRRGGLLGGDPREGDASEIDESSVSSEVHQHKPLNKPITVVTTESPGEGSINPASSFEEPDSLLPIPSFDYSHFARGGNDMAPNTPARSISVLPAVPESTDEPGSVTKIDVSNNRTATAIKNILDEAPIQNPRIGIVASKNEEDEAPAGPMLMHGVPTFLPSLSQIRVSQVSAHPRGSHVLLISSDALLFAYGLNTNGQLGIGKKSKAKSSKMGFVTSPTIVTPLLENGGKTIACAAGVDHSLVVVKTDETRVGSWRQRRKSSTKNPISLSRSHSLPAGVTEDRFDADNLDSSEASGNAKHQHYHHQLYGFGNNTNMSLGLANPNSTRGQKGEDVLLPRRVALHCKVWPDTTGGPPAGIFQIAASDKHSAALVRRASGAVELYTWGDASQGALGLDLSDIPYEGKASDIIPCPTMVESMSYIPPSFDEHKSQHGNAVSQSLSNNEYPAQVALGPDCTFVVSSSGTCTVFGTSKDGLLGLGHDITSALEPTKLPLPATGIKSISVGGSHAVALTEGGNAYLWGSNSHGKLAGVLPDSAETATPSEEEMRLEISMESEGPILLEGSDGSWVPVEGPESENKNIVWTPHPVEIFNSPITKRSREWKRVSSDRDLRLKRSPSNQSEEPSNAESQQVGKVKLSQVCAGHDSTVFVTNEGRVLSCGQQSGRLGIGEVNDDVVAPRPMFGGLRLWHEARGNNHEQ
mmetsp:Transcript_16781/g.26045  ORF Transcript_16781/g.26045 Transcript_16781/m.26045 type:complete len:874 (-) Transcript_16781:92-2713(-)